MTKRASGAIDEEREGMDPEHEDVGDRGQDDAAERRGEPGEAEEESDEDGDADTASILDDLFADDEDEPDEGDEAEGEGDEEEPDEEGDEEDSKEEDEEADAKGAKAMLKRIKTLSAKRREVEAKVETLTGELTTTKKSLEGFTSLYPGANGLADAKFDKRFMDTLDALRKPAANAGVRQVIQAVLDKMKGREPEGDLSGRSSDRSREQDGSARDEAALGRLERIERREAEQVITTSLRKAGVVKELHKSLTRDAASRLSFKDGAPSEEQIAKAVREAIRDSGYSKDFLTGKAQRRTGPPTGGRRSAGVVTGREDDREGREEKAPKSQTERFARGRRRLAAALGARG